MEAICMARSAAVRKAKKTFTLSQEAVGFLETTGKAKRISTSQVLEELIKDKKLEAERDSISARIRSYYDSLSDAEVEDSARWGEFAESQFTEE